MLGYVLGIALVLTVLTPVLLADVFADSIIVNFDKQLYELGDTLTITGEILDVGMPVIAMSIYDPDGKVLSANNLEISSENIFSKTINLESPFYEKSGEYLVKLDYGQISQNHYFLMDGELSIPEIFIEDVEPEVILLYTEKKQYTDNEVIEITGLVSSVDSPTVLIGIYDPFGMPAGFYFGAIDSNMEFTTSFLAKDGVNFRVDGTYSIKAHYAESEVTSFFDYYSVLPETEQTTNETTTETTNETTTETTNEITNETTTETTNETTNETTTETTNETTTETTNKTITTEQTNTSQESSTTTTPSQSVINDTPSKKSENKKEISNTVLENNPIKKTDDGAKKEIKIKKENNLTVEDIELGKLLNQIQLECDSSTYTDTISYYDGMGPALYRLCKFDSSLNFFNESLMNNPNDVEILVNKGSTLGKLGYYSEAIVFYDHAIRIDSDFLPAKNNKANALANLGNLDDAILLYTEILEKNPSYFTAQKNLQIALSANHDNQITPVDVSDEKTINPKPQSEPVLIINSEKQTSQNFFDEVGIAFSTLGSLFDFLN
ncbi:tetratricopeptide repeat protein [Nitrosopumilus sp.]|uniref:tetratricopeptide repeat protein n=1 Tax=Nitrosopumilus sp. TaxID=2024843 RepID=UPI00247DDB56|nr:tetratricopeptide repeat protein [Nitrosopumilus sp.]MCV0430633.1 tetratricopeptide repeat protein [Nitrosopumilus sp.]